MNKALYSLIPQVSLSSEGTFKYILIDVRRTANKDLIGQFVRGDKDLEYHKQNFQKFQKEFAQAAPSLEGEKLVENQNVYLSCPGGGRVVHSGR